MSGPTRTATCLWQPGEEGRLISSAGGVATTSLDPEQKNDYTYDMSVWLERELIANLGVRAGFVHRAELQRRGTINTNQPYDAFNIATSVIDPGPDGRAGTADDGRVDPGVQPGGGVRRAPDPEPRDQRAGRVDVRHVGDRDEQAHEQSLVGVGILLVHVIPRLSDGVEHLSPEPE